MKLKTPSFWYRSDLNFQAALLLPLSWVYRLGRAAHVAYTKPRSAPCPIICVGNINAGGSGKTPTCLALMALVKNSHLSKKPAFLLRGYGGNLTGPLLVNSAVHKAQHVGEEALILAASSDVIIARNRYSGAAYTESLGHDLIVMDDGFQNPSLKATLNIVVVNGDMGFGNGQLLPAGPLREPLSAGLSRADAVVVIGADRHGIQDKLPADLPVFQAQIKTAAEDLPDAKAAYFAFAGLGYPDKFFNYLRDDLKLDIQEVEAFADHHAYTLENLEALHAKAKQAGLKLITTEKDMQHIMRLTGFEKFDITALPIALEFDESADVEAFLRGAL